MAVDEKIRFDQGALYRAARAALARALTDPIPATLGYLDENGAPLLKVDTDEELGRYYFTPLEGLPLEETSESASPTYGIAFNAGARPLDARFLVFGAPIYVERDRLSGEWIIAGLQPRRAAEFFGGLEPPASDPIQLTQWTPGLIAPDTPPSMRAVVFGAPYTLAGVFRYISTQMTKDFTADVPTVSGTARYVSVEVVFETGELAYQLGDVIDAGYTHEQAYYADNGEGTILPQPPRSHFRAGYIQLVAGMTAIETEHIWAVQEIYTKTDYTDILVACGEVVTVDDEIVTV